MAAYKENIILADCKAEEIKLFIEGLSKNGEIYSVKSHPANWARAGAISEIRRYMKYFTIAFKYFFHRKRYGDILCWQQFYGLIIGFYCNIFKIKKTNRITVVNYTYKEKKRFKRLYQWFMKMCLSGGYVDFLHVPSYEYADTISKEFGFSRDKIIVAPFGIDDIYEKFWNLGPPEDYKKDGYMVAIGRSNRDFNFLINAWEGLTYPLVIISDSFKGKPDNPKVSIRRDISGDAQYQWLINCKTIIIPIDDGSICSGDTVLLTGMSFKKIVLVTMPSTLAEMYIQGDNGLTVSKDVESLQRIVKDIINGKFDHIQETARKCFLEKYSRFNLGTAVIDAIDRGGTKK